MNLRRGQIAYLLMYYLSNPLQLFLNRVWFRVHCLMVVKAVDVVKYLADGPGFKKEI